ncbi:uncharacterized protein LOC123488545 [Coregonus clupeaformis]|uniref:uncharacterized protein LOC123488545 n=1 Tax=Coregonus clupeaformis TaxID=59861 RepID=UPI001E1C76DF|nr:uncharacterized protein LOC123488545 [Coregonus clupeaformis]
MKKAGKTWFRAWCSFFFVCCFSTTETKTRTRTRNGRKQRKIKETEFIELTDLGKNTSFNGSCKLSSTTKNESPETFKKDTPTSSKTSNNTLNKESPGHLSVEDCKAQPFYPTNPSPQKESPLILQFGPLLDYTADHWPYFPPNLLPSPPLEQNTTMTEEIFGDLALLKPGQSMGDAWNTSDIRAEEPCRLEVMKNQTGLWGSSVQRQPQQTSPGNHLSHALGQYLDSTTIPMTSDLQKLGLTSDFMKVPEETLFIEVWDLGECAGDHRYKAKWAITEEHGIVLDQGTWLQNDDNW